jgi:hypothetical protein
VQSRVEINWKGIIRPLINPPIAIKPLSLYKPIVGHKEKETRQRRHIKNIEKERLREKDIVWKNCKRNRKREERLIAFDSRPSIESSLNLDLLLTHLREHSKLGNCCRLSIILWRDWCKYWIISEFSGILLFLDFFIFYFLSSTSCCFLMLITMWERVR